MFELLHCPSWDMEKAKDHYEGKTYECENCGCRLENHEVFLKSGKAYCGCCSW